MGVENWRMTLSGRIHSLWLSLLGGSLGNEKTSLFEVGHGDAQSGLNWLPKQVLDRLDPGLSRRVGSHAMKESGVWICLATGDRMKQRQRTQSRIVKDRLSSNQAITDENPQDSKSCVERPYNEIIQESPHYISATGKEWMTGEDISVAPRVPLRDSLSRSRFASFVVVLFGSPVARHDLSHPNSAFFHDTRANARPSPHSQRIKEDGVAFTSKHPQPELRWPKSTSRILAMPQRN